MAGGSAGHLGSWGLNASSRGIQGLGRHHVDWTRSLSEEACHRSACLPRGAWGCRTLSWPGGGRRGVEGSAGRAALQTGRPERGPPPPAPPTFSLLVCGPEVHALRLECLSSSPRDEGAEGAPATCCAPCRASARGRLPAAAACPHKPHPGQAAGTRALKPPPFRVPELQAPRASAGKGWGESAPGCVWVFRLRLPAGGKTNAGILCRQAGWAQSLCSGTDGRCPPPGSAPSSRGELSQAAQPFLLQCAWGPPAAAPAPCHWPLKGLFQAPAHLSAPPSASRGLCCQGNKQQH